MICDPEYNMQILTKEKSSLYIERTKDFYADAEKMLLKKKEVNI